MGAIRGSSALKVVIDSVNLYSATVYDINIGDTNGRIILSTDPDGREKALPSRPNLEQYKKLAKDLDFLHLFVDSRAALVREFPKLRESLRSSGMLWISWPKKPSGRASDLDENVVRELGLGIGLVDVKVCAVDDIWSGLKFVVRLEDR